MRGSRLAVYTLNKPVEQLDLVVTAIHPLSSHQQHDLVLIVDLAEASILRGLAHFVGGALPGHPASTPQHLIQNLRMGPFLAVHVVNTAMRIMAARYPAELVRRPLPPQYDLRKILALTITDQQHEIAVMIFNRRTTSPTDLTEDDVASELESLDVVGQMQVFVTLFFMYSTKVGAMKHRTGIE